MLPSKIAEALQSIAEKLDAGVADAASQQKALAQAAGLLASIQDYIRADETRVTVTVLTCAEILSTPEWWAALGEYERVPFLETAYGIRKGLSELPRVLESTSLNGGQS